MIGFKFRPAHHTITAIIAIITQKFNKFRAKVNWFIHLNLEPIYRQYVRKSSGLVKFKKGIVKKMFVLILI